MMYAISITVTYLGAVFGGCTWLVYKIVDQLHPLVVPIWLKCQLLHRCVNITISLSGTLPMSLHRH